MDMHQADTAAAAVATTDKRVTMAEIEAEIVSVEYFRPGIAPHVTVCVLQLRNGYTILGKSAPADPANFDEDFGKRLAADNAKRQIWPLLGFRLCDQLMEDRNAKDEPEPSDGGHRADPAAAEHQERMRRTGGRTA